MSFYGHTTPYTPSVNTLLQTVKAWQKMEEHSGLDNLLFTWQLKWFGCLEHDDALTEAEQRTPQLSRYGTYEESFNHLAVPSIPALGSPPHVAPSTPQQAHQPHNNPSLPYSNGSNKASSQGSNDPQQRSPATASPAATLGPHAAQNIHTKSISLPHDLPSAIAASMHLPGSDSSPKSALGPCSGGPEATLDKPAVEASEAAHVGTWMHRQYRMLAPIHERGAAAHSQPGSIANAASASATQGHAAVQQQQQQQQQAQQQGQGSVFATAEAAQIAAAVAAQRPQAAQQGSQQQELKRELSESGIDAAAEAAWRWRFTRRWQAEQQRAVCQEPSSSLDKTEEALAYLQAGGGVGWNMQVGIARTHSTDASALHSQGHGSLLAGDMLLDDGSFSNTGSLARAVHRGALGEDTATRHVNSINRRAMQLLEQQVQLERAAEARWATTLEGGPGEAWVGHHLATVEIDDWGTFRFLVLRVRGRSDRQRILVRGRNYCTEAQITEEMNHKMMQLAQQTGCHVESVEVMGGGVMEWRRERDRHLHLHAGWAAMSAMAAVGGRPTSGQEVLNLAAVLAKQALPVHFKVSIEGTS